ncbi:MAG: hypothetical protein QG570_656 [Patescibacteria group bacterium]|nr:hypothetical protein [Patescibacteria group bacterium]
MQKVSISTCNLDKALAIIGGKWKLHILWYVAQSTLRFSELEKLVKGITQKMLAQSLRDLERDGLITRKVYPEIPPKVEYTITETGISLGEALRELDKWGARFFKE